MPEQPRRLAVLIDAENVPAKHCDELLIEISKFGVAKLKRAYGNFTSKNLGSWKAAAEKHSIKIEHQFSTVAGKNSSDIALVIDAMDLLHSKRFDGFFLVSGDSDFAALARRIREEGLVVFGFGKEKAPRSVVAAFDDFVCIEHSPSVKKTASATKSGNVPTRPPSDSKDQNDLMDIVSKAGGDAGWARLSQVAKVIRDRLPHLLVGIQGRKKVFNLLKASGLFELKDEGPKGKSQPFVRIKTRP